MQITNTHSAKRKVVLVALETLLCLQLDGYSERVKLLPGISDFSSSKLTLESRYVWDGKIIPGFCFFI